MKERGPLSTTHAIAVAAPILSALSHVHQKGIIHRDVKPANIFFAVEPDGHVIPKILDFGIAKLPAAGSALTMDGSVLGTPHYMSPEQIRGGEDLDGRSDMFSLAVVLYEMLTGVRVFQRDSAAASLAAVLEHEVDPDPRIEPRLWIALSRALSKRPYERYATCAELADALRNAIDASDEDFAQSLQELRPRSDAATDRASGARPVEVGSSSAASRPKRKPKKSGSLGVTVVAAGGAALLAVGLTLALTRSGSPAHADDQPAASSSVTPTNATAPMGSAAPSAAVVLGGTTGARDVPPPDPTSTTVELGGDPTPATTPTPTPKPLGRQVSTVVGRNTGAGPRPTGTVKPSGGGGKPGGDPATRPGF